MTPAVTVHGAAFDPFSKPGLPSSCCVEPPLPTTVTLTVVECVIPPPVPVTVALPTRIVMLDEPLPGAAIDVGAKFAVAPAGKPDTESAIDELKLPAIEVLIVAAPEPLCAIVNDDGDAPIEKSAGVPDVVTVKAKSSTTNDVFSFEFSTPTK